MVESISLDWNVKIAVIIDGNAINPVDICLDTELIGVGHLRDPILSR